MPLWGKSDSLSSAGTVTVDYDAKTVTAIGADFVSTGIATGNVITFGDRGASGQAIVSGVTSATVLSIGSTSALSGSAISGAAYNISESPVYLVTDSNYTVGEVFGVDTDEAGVARTTSYAVTHAGWVGITSYTDTHGNLRVKHEVLVAMGKDADGNGGIDGDAADDDILLP